jgi:aspartyl-tRNA synthetase
MVKAFGIAGIPAEAVEERFGALYRAFQYGAPPHGGMAAGVDRIVMLLVGAENLREITMFPMNQQANDLLMGAPSSRSSPTAVLPAFAFGAVFADFAAAAAAGFSAGGSALKRII